MVKIEEVIETTLNEYLLKRLIHNEGMAEVIYKEDIPLITRDLVRKLKEYNNAEYD